MSGFTNFGAAKALAATLPNGTTGYVALFTTLPALDGTGGVEVADASYARVAWSAWQAEAAPPGVTAAWGNNGLIAFAAFTGAVPGVVGFGVFDAAVGGNLIVRDNIVDGTGAPMVMNFSAGDIAEFLSAALMIGILS